MSDHVARWPIHVNEVARAAVLGAVYFLAACLAARYTRFEGGVALIWVANALLFADLRYRPNYSWIARCLACAIASGFATTLFGLGLHASPALATINIAEAVGGALLMRRIRPVPGHLSSLRELGTLILVVGLTLPALSAFPGALAAHLVSGVPFWPNWLSWFAAHALGVCMVVPFLNLVLNGDVSGWAKQARRAEWIEAGLLIGAVTATSILVFSQEQLPLLFLPFAPVMLTVFRLGRLGAAASILILAIIGTTFTLAEQGPVSLITGGTGLKVQFFQFYLAVAMMMALPAAAELKRRKRLYSRLQQSSALYKVIADRTGDIILAVQLDGTIEYASPSIQKIGGYDPRQMRGRKAREIIYSDDVAMVAERQAQTIADPDETFMTEFRARRASGELGWFESHSRAIMDEEGRVTGTVNIIREVSERKTKELDLAQAADTDPLTGLANRRSLLAAYKRLVPAALDQGKSVCIAVFDLDHFKQVNDGFGHDAGDQVLQSFANALRSVVRESDVVARLGGEEFAALLVGVNIEQAHRICDRVRQDFRLQRFSFGEGRVLQVTVSGGLSEITHPWGSLDKAVKMADMALYEAKATGRDRLAIAA